MRADNKDITKKYFYPLWASKVVGTQRIGTLSCLVLWTEKEYKRQVVVVKIGRAFASCLAKPKVPKRFLKLSLLFSYLN